MMIKLVSEMHLCQQVIGIISSSPDLGAVRSDSLSYDNHVRVSAFRAMRLAGMMMQAIKTCDPEFPLKVNVLRQISTVVEYA